MSQCMFAQLSCSLEYTDCRVLFFDLFYLGLTARQEYFTHFEPSQSLSGAKTRDPREKSPDQPQAERLVSHVTRARLETTAVRWRVI